MPLTNHTGSFMNSVTDELSQAMIKLFVLAGILAAISGCVRVDPNTGERVSNSNNTVGTVEDTAFTPQSSTLVAQIGMSTWVYRTCIDGTSYLATTKGHITPEVEPNTNGFVKACK